MKILAIKIALIITITMLQPPFDFVDTYQFGVTTYSSTKIGIWFFWLVSLTFSIVWLTKNVTQIQLCILLGVCRPRFDTSFYFLSWAKVHGSIAATVSLLWFFWLGLFLGYLIYVGRKENKTEKEDPEDKVVIYI